MKESTATAARGLARESTARPRAEVTVAAPGKNIYTIALRELRAYFDSLVAYVVLGGSLLGIGIYFFLFQQGGFWQVDRATMTRMFEALPIALSILVIPLVTMRALAEEKRSGTIELLITLPVTDAQVILGKYFAALGMVLILLFSTLIYPIAMFIWPWHLGALDWGPVWSGYTGLLFFSSAGIAVGVLFSSVTESQIIAFFLTAFALAVMVVLSAIAQLWPGVFGDVVNFFSLASRYEGFAHGLIDTRDVVYFLSIAVLCLLIAFRSLESRKWS
jgi:ABC-2 type transport system permease protein